MGMRKDLMDVAQELGMGFKVCESPIPVCTHAMADSGRKKVSSEIIAVVLRGIQEAESFDEANTVRLYAKKTDESTYVELGAMNFNPSLCVEDKKEVVSDFLKDVISRTPESSWEEYALQSMGVGEFQQWKKLGIALKADSFSLGSIFGEWATLTMSLGNSSVELFTDKVDTLPDEDDDLDEDEVSMGSEFDVYTIGKTWENMEEVLILRNTDIEPYALDLRGCKTVEDKFNATVNHLEEWRNSNC